MTDHQAEYTPVRGTELRRRRELKDWTIVQLAAESGVASHTISRLELSSDGTRTRSENVTKLARALGCARGWLVSLGDA